MLVLILVLVLFQVGVLSNLFAFWPSLNLILAVFLALRFRGHSGGVLGLVFCVGLLWDLFLYTPFGLSGLLLVLLVSLLGFALRFAGFNRALFFIFSFGASLFWRGVFGFPHFTTLYLVGALEDSVLSVVLLLTLIPIWEKFFIHKDLQLTLGIW